MQCLYLKDHLDVLNNAHKIRDPQLSRHQQNIKTQAHQQKVKAPTKKLPGEVVGGALCGFLSARRLEAGSQSGRPSFTG